MEKEDRERAMKIINAMIELKDKMFEEEGLEHYLKFKFTCRELRHGDYSLGEEIIVDEIKEHEEENGR